MYPTQPFLVGFDGGFDIGTPLHQSWFVKNQDGSIIMKDVGDTLIDAQNDLVSKLRADGWTSV